MRGIAMGRVAAMIRERRAAAALLPSALSPLPGYSVA
jgi:hypothetical protein